MAESTGKATNVRLQKIQLNKESSPYRDSSPFTHSPRLFWKEQTASPKSRFDTSENDSEASTPLSPKRNSIENLKKQSRVKNSSMFAREQKHEYDPTLVQPLDRPLAAGRPLNSVVQSNNNNNNSPTKGHLHSRSESQTRIPILSPSKTSPAKLPTQSSFSSPAKSPPPEGRASPTKSSLVSNGRFNSPQYNADSSAVFSDDEDMVQKTPRPLRRHAKSVTFDTRPPQITEFEMVTPDPSVATASRDGSYDSEEDETEEEMSFDQDDSFDASLEDTEKTPVVLPEDWRHMSPDAANTSLTDDYDDVFDGRDNSPMPSANPNGPRNTSRLGSTASDSDARPLPPLPGFSTQEGSRRRDSSIGLSAAAERANDRRRSLPQLPQAAGISKHDLLNMREVSMTLEDRLRLMNFDNERDSSTPTQEMQNKENKEMDEEVTEADMEQSELGGGELRLAPRISRDSILRRVKSRNFEGGEEDDSEVEYSHFDPEDSPERSYGDLADLDPDVPIPSREVSSNFDEHPRQVSGVSQSEADSVVDAYSYGDVTQGDHEDTEDVDGSSMSELEDYERDSSVIHHPMPPMSEDEDDTSEYSPQPEEQPTSQSTIDSSGPPTPTVAPSSPAVEEKQAKQDEMFANLDGKDVDLSLDPEKTAPEEPSTPLDKAPKLSAMRDALRRPVTPDAGDAQDDESGSEPSTPDSVIRHPVPQSPIPQEDIEVPQREATIRGEGGKLKTRPSLIPDEVDMAATRRHVSGGYAPPVPERSPKRQSMSFETGQVDEEDSQLSVTTRERRMLDLNLGDDANDLSFGLDKEFDHIIAAQKVMSLLLRVSNSFC